MPAPPSKLSVQSELDRKVGDAVVRYIGELDRGTQSPGQIQLKLKGLWDASAGLLGPDKTELLNAALQHVAEIT